MYLGCKYERKKHTIINNKNISLESINTSNGHGNNILIYVNYIMLLQITNL